MIALALANSLNALEGNPQAKLHLARHVCLREEQRISKLAGAGGFHTLQAGEGSGNQVQGTSCRLHDPVCWDAVDIKRIIHMVEIDMVQNIDRLRDQIQTHVVLAIDIDRFLEVHVPGVKRRTTVVITRGQKRYCVVAVKRLAVDLIGAVGYTDREGQAATQCNDRRDGDVAKDSGERSLARLKRRYIDRIRGED